MNKKVYSCHQPNFIPWIGFFHKILSSDIFVILDEVQYTKNSVANRNSIRTSNGSSYVNVPISKKINNSSFFKYNEAKIAFEDWYVKPLKSIYQNYNRSEYFNLYFDKLSDLFKIGNFCKMNIEFIYFIKKELEINTEIILMSNIGEDLGKNNDLIISIGKSISANSYLSGNGAKKYNDIDKFNDEGIELVYQKYTPVNYKQLHSPFIENLSIIDLLFNEGPNSKDILYTSKM